MIILLLAIIAATLLFGWHAVLIGLGIFALMYAR